MGNKETANRPHKFCTYFCCFYQTSNALDPNPSNVQWIIVSTTGVAGATNNSSSFNDIVFQPGNSQVIYASRDATGSLPTANIIRSIDGGNTWCEFDNGITLTGILRIAIETSNANPNMLYAITCATQSAGIYSFMYSINTLSSSLCTSSSSWNVLNSGIKLPPGYPGCGSWETHGVDPSRVKSLCVSPTTVNPNETIVFGDTYPIYYEINNGGSSFSANDANNPPHNDIRNIEFSSDGLTLWTGCDGGVFKSIDFGLTWTPKNKGLGVETIHGMAWSATNPNYALTGNQDCGTNRFDGTNWEHVYGADGLTPMIDYKDPTNMYASISGGGIERSSDFGNTFTHTACSPIGSDWLTIEVMNTSNPSVYYQAGQEIRRTSNKGILYPVSWSTISNFGTTYGSGNYEALELFTAPSNPDYLYAWMHNFNPSLPPLLIYTTNANDPNPTWSGDIQASATPTPIPPNWLNGMAVDENNPNNIYLVYGNLLNPTDKIYNVSINPSTNTIISNNITADLPAQADATAIVREKGSNGGLYVATDMGVYYTNNSYINAYIAAGTLPVWQAFNTNLPNAHVSYGGSTLLINYAKNTIRVGTYGRGIWESNLACPPNAFDAETTPYTADAFIEAGIITSNTTDASTPAFNVTYRATNQVDLQPGFHASATSGTSFHAFIHGCSAPGNSFRRTNQNQPSGSSSAGNEASNPVLINNTTTTMLPTKLGTNIKLGIYPNPTSGLVYLNLSAQNAGVLLVNVSDVNGNQLLHNRYDANEGANSFKVDLSNLNSGVYFINITVCL
ncbi:MAG: T9SS type A sorting domain-containing protein [Bacteroidia bacterium]